MRTFHAFLLALVGLVVFGGPSADDAALATPAQSPPSFSSPLEIDHPYLPFVEHRIRLYRQVRGEGVLHVIDVFHAHTRTFTWQGDEIACRVLEEREVADGEILEISQNYFAQADDGSVWYFGEVVNQYEGGEVVAHGGSWLVGGAGPGDPVETVSAATPTVFMPARPAVGDTWKAEDLPEAGIEEFDRVVALHRRLHTPYATFRSVLEVEERTPDVGTKWYARGMGFVRQRGSDDEIVTLIEVEDEDDAEEQAEELAEILDELLE
jgi:hypothetical protein